MTGRAAAPEPHRGMDGPGPDARWRRTLLGELRGMVLEIGAGSGANFAVLSPDIRWIGLEPDPNLHQRLQRAAAAYGHRGGVVEGVAERIPLADRSVDAVLGTLVLCSVADQTRALAEVRRVLRPGGRFVFLEHVASVPGTWSRRAQALWAPISRLVDGCDPSRETWRTIQQAGFDHLELERFALRGPLGVEIPHIAGWATTSPARWLTTAATGGLEQMGVRPGRPTRYGTPSQATTSRVC